jgi:hypothetical protein
MLYRMKIKSEWEKMRKFYCQSPTEAYVRCVRVCVVIQNNVYMDIFMDVFFLYMDVLDFFGYLMTVFGFNFVMNCEVSKS